MTVQHLTDTRTDFPSVWIVVLNWNGRDDTLECLDSVAAIEYPNFEVIIVDNGSIDGSVAAVQEKFPHLIIRETGHNLGYAGGNNAGIEEAVRGGADYILLLNNDTVVATDVLDELVKAADNHSDAAAFSPKIYSYSEPKRVWYAGARWSRPDGNFQYINNAGELDDGSFPEDAMETDYASGCAMFFRSDMVRRVGVLDPLFFLTFEETDWCYRVRRLGYRCLVIPKAKVWHKGSMSFKGDDSPLYRYFYVRNRLLWAERHLSLGARLAVWRRTLREIWAWTLVPISGREKTWKEFYWSLRAWMRHLGRWWRTPGFWVVRLAARDYLLRRFGDCPPIVRELNRAKT